MQDISNEDKVDILLSVNDTINGKIGEKISALLDEQEATAAAAGSTASGAGSSQDQAGMAPPTHSALDALAPEVHAGHPLAEPGPDGGRLGRPVLALDRLRRLAQEAVSVWVF